MMGMMVDLFGTDRKTAFGKKVLFHTATISAAFWPPNNPATAACSNLFDTFIRAKPELLYQPPPSAQCPKPKVCVPVNACIRDVKKLIVRLTSRGLEQVDRGRYFGLALEVQLSDDG